ncbi:hypothetical protein YB2330_002164 [Saitoella coloradoensis]
MSKSSPLFHSAQEDLSSGDEDPSSPRLGDDEYEIAGILCERRALPTDRDHLARYYLVEWKGYPVYWQATWEPGNNIPQDTLAAWKAKKKEIQKKGEPEFDWKKWQKGYEADLIAHPETYPYVWAAAETDKEDDTPETPAASDDESDLPSKVLVLKMTKKPATPAAPPATIDPPAASSKSKKLASPAAKPSASKATDEVSSRASFGQAQPSKSSTMMSAQKKSAATTAQLPAPRPNEKTSSMASDAPVASIGPTSGSELELSLKKRAATAAPPQAPDAKIMKKSLFSSPATSAGSINRPALTSLAQKPATFRQGTNLQQVLKKPATQSVTSKAPDAVVVPAKPMNKSLLKSSTTSAEADRPVGSSSPSSVSKLLAKSVASAALVSKPKLTLAPTNSAAALPASKTSGGFSFGSYLAELEVNISPAQPPALASVAVQTLPSRTQQPEVAVVPLGPQVKPVKTADGKTGEEEVYNLVYGPQVRDVGLVKLQYSDNCTEKKILKELLGTRQPGIALLPLHITKFLSFYQLTQFFGHQKGALQPPDTILDLIYVQEEAAVGSHFREVILSMGGVGLVFLPAVTLMVFVGSGEPLHSTFGLWSMSVPKSGLRMAVYPPIKKGSVDTAFWYGELRLPKEPATYRRELLGKVLNLPLIEAGQIFAVLGSEQNLECVELQECLLTSGALDAGNDLCAATFVFIHRLLLPQLHLLPHLTALKSRPNTRFYLFGTSFVQNPVITDGEDYITKNTKYQATSIFPHGGVIVMTPEMIVNSPNVVEFVLGYAGHGGWNVMVCSSLISEVEAFCQEGLTSESTQELGDIVLAILVIKEALLEKRVVEFELLVEMETVFQSLLASLQLYQAWSCETYRRFIVLHNVKDDTERDWTQGIEVHTPEQFVKMKAMAHAKAKVVAGGKGATTAM